MTITALSETRRSRSLSAIARSAANGSDNLTLRVAACWEETPTIKHLEFVGADGAELPAFAPGSHLIFTCGDRRNAYSLTGAGHVPERYGISVRLKPDGAGGSQHMHALTVGDLIDASAPRSLFAPVRHARHHVLIGGGIGITPILSHARAAAKWHRSFEVLYSYRLGDGAHLDELRDICTAADARLIEAHDAASTTAALQTILGAAKIGTHLYICGPPAMIESTRRLASGLGWPDERIHFEVFTAPEIDAGHPFHLRLPGGGEVDVPAGISALEALEAAGVSIPNLCRKGICGECRTTVTDGVPLHRDMVLTSADKAAGSCFLPCVSRAVGDYLEVKL